MFKEIIDIKTYLTNTQTPHHLSGQGVLCVYFFLGRSQNRKQSKVKPGKRERKKKSIKST